MMLFLWATLAIPEGLRELPLTIIDAPPPPGEKRPTTESTLLAWLEGTPMPGSCLFFSSQPFVKYQNAVIRKALPSNMQVETIGLGGGEDLPTSVLLDNVAKWLYASDQ